MGYTGRAVVVVSCVTADPPHRPHPHSLVGKEGCKKGVCTLEIPADTMAISFNSLGIQVRAKIKKKTIRKIQISLTFNKWAILEKLNF